MGLRQHERSTFIMNEDYNIYEEHTNTTANTEPIVSEPYRYKYENGEKSEYSTDIDMLLNILNSEISK